MAVFLTGQSKIYIGGVKSLTQLDLDADDFDEEVWTEIKEVETIGTFGDTAEVTTFTAIRDGRVRKLKGSRDAGNVEIVAGLDYADAGQLALVAAEKTRNNYAFKIEFPDAPAGGTPSERYFVALVTTATEQPDGVNAVLKLNASLAINSNVVKVAAAAGA